MDDCIFCKIVKGELPTTKVYEDTDILAFLDIAPINVGHSLVIPKAHYPNIYKTPENLLAKMMIVAKKISHALETISPDGVNIAMNNKKAAGQVVFHSHIHIIPRQEGDGFKLWEGKRNYSPGEKEDVAKKIIAAL